MPGRTSSGDGDALQLGASRRRIGPYKFLAKIACEDCETGGGTWCAGQSKPVTFLPLRGLLGGEQLLIGNGVCCQP